MHNTNISDEKGEELQKEFTKLEAYFKALNNEAGPQGSTRGVVEPQITEAEKNAKDLKEFLNLLKL